MMDKIHISGLKTDAIIGVYEYERTIKQPIELDIIFTIDTSKPAHSDDVNDALDYAEVTKQVIAWIDQTQFQLIEKLANHIAAKLLDTFSAQTVQLTLRKFPSDLAVAHVGVEVRKDRTG